MRHKKEWHAIVLSTHGFQALLVQNSKLGSTSLLHGVTLVVLTRVEAAIQKRETSNRSAR